MYKPGTLTATIKMESHCRSLGDYAKEHGIHPFTAETDRKFNIPRAVFGDTMEVIAHIPEIGLITCRSDDGVFYQIPLLFVQNFVLWDDFGL